MIVRLNKLTLAWDHSGVVRAILAAYIVLRDGATEEVGVDMFIAAPSCLRTSTASLPSPLQCSCCPGLSLVFQDLLSGP